MNKSMHNYFNDSYVTISKLMNEFIFSNEEDKSSGVDLSGKTFVITGNLVHYKNRNELIKNIEQLGGKVTGSVSAKTSYLINNDTESNSSKNKKAKELGVPIISEEEFINIIKIQEG